MIYGHGGDIYTHKPDLDFSVNVNPLGPPEGVVRAAKQGAERMAAYPDSRCRMLREKLSLKQDIAEDHYIFGNGAADLIYRLALAEKPGRALIPIPAFSEYEQALKTVGCKITYYETKPESCFCIDEHFLNELDGQYDMVLLCSPTNPSGQMIGKELLMEIAKICEDRRIRLVLDECFIGFLENADELSMLRETERYPHLFLLRAFTKIYAMPGMRLGYGITGNKNFLKKMKEKQIPWSLNSIGAFAGEIMFRDKEYIQKTRSLILSERERMYTEAKKLPAFRAYYPYANFLLLKIQNPDVTSFDAFERCIKNNLMIRDCSSFQCLDGEFIRFCIMMPEDNTRLLEVLRKI